MCGRTKIFGFSLLFHFVLIECQHIVNKIERQFCMRDLFLVQDAVYNKNQDKETILSWFFFVERLMKWEVHVVVKRFVYWLSKTIRNNKCCSKWCGNCKYYRQCKDDTTS